MTSLESSVLLLTAVSVLFLPSISAKTKGLNPLLPSDRSMVRSSGGNPMIPKWFALSHSDAVIRKFNNLAAEERQKIILHTSFGRTEFGPHRVLWIKACLTGAYTLVCLIGLLSNLLVVYILVFMHRRALTSITNIFVLVLAISDVILCGFNIPVQIYYELRETVSLTNMSCKVIFSLFALPTHVSCLTMLLIACDRYQIIIHPLLPRMSTKMAITLIVVVVLMGVVNSIPLAVYSTVSYAILSDYLGKEDEVIEKANFVGINHRFDEPYTYCVEDWPSADARLVYSIVVFCVHFAIPLVITALLYGRIYLRLHVRQIHRQSVERKRRTNKILVRIVVCFAVFWSPWTCFSLWLEIQAYDLQRHSLELINTTHSKEYHLTNVLDDRNIYDNFQGEKLIHSSRSSERLLKPSNLRSHPTREDIKHNLPEHPLTRKINDVHITTKLMDLLLKLIAMTSSCINPWLYGWLNKFFWSLYRKYIHRRRPAKMKRMEVVGRPDGRYNKKVIYHNCKPVLTKTVNKQASSSNLDNSWNRKRANFIRNCRFCGVNYVFCLFMSPQILSSGRQTKSDEYRNDILAASQNNSHGRVSKRHSPTLKESSETPGCRSNNRGSGNSQSLSNRQKHSRTSSELGPGQAIGINSPVTAQIDRIFDEHLEDNDNGRFLQGAPKYGMHHFMKSGRRFSPRLSSSSFTTSNYPSTKLTTFLSSSGYAPTPRSSFLRLREQEGEKAMPSGVYLTKEHMNCYLTANEPGVIRESSILLNDGNNKDQRYNSFLYPPNFENDAKCETIVTLHCPLLAQQCRYSIPGVADLTVLREKDSDSNVSMSQENPDDECSAHHEHSACTQLTVPVTLNESSSAGYQRISHPTESSTITTSRQPNIRIMRCDQVGSDEGVLNVLRVQLDEEQAVDIPFVDEIDHELADDFSSPNAIRVEESKQFPEDKIINLVFPQIKHCDIAVSNHEQSQVVNRTECSVTQDKLSTHKTELDQRQTRIPNRSPEKRRNIRRLSLQSRKHRSSTSSKRLQRQSYAAEYAQHHGNPLRSQKPFLNEESTVEIDEFAMLSHIVATEALQKKRQNRRFHSISSDFVNI